MNNVHIKEVRTYWAYCFDQVFNQGVRDYQMTQYIKELHYTDSWAAETLLLLCALPSPWEKPIFTNQLTLFNYGEKVRI